MSKKRLILGAGALVVACGFVLAYEVGRARAYDIPTTNTLSYTGQLMTFGQPDNSSHQMYVSLYLTGTTTPLCASTATSVTCLNGQFTLPLPAACVPYVHQNPNLDVQVTVDGTSLGHATLTAVPYAVEADTASNAAPGSALGTSITALQTQSPINGIFSSSTVVTNAAIAFTGAPGSKPSFSGSQLTLASNTTAILVELWGGGGGGAGGGNGTNGAGGGTTCLNFGAANCGSPIFYATGGGGGFPEGNGGVPTVGSGVGGNVNLSGTSSASITGSTASVNYWPGGIGGAAPRGGGGGGSGAAFAGQPGQPFGGGGGGGGVQLTNTAYQSGSGGGGAGYSQMLIAPPSGVYYFTIAPGGAGGTPGSPSGSGAAGYNGGVGGSGGIVVTAYN